MGLGDGVGRPLFWSGPSALGLFWHYTWGVAPGWDGSHLWRSGCRDANHVLGRYTRLG